LKSLSGQVRGKFIVIVLLLIVILAGWEARNWLAPKRVMPPAAPPVLQPPPAKQPPPIVLEARPALPLKTARKPLMAPVRIPQRPISPKKGSAPPAVSPPPVPVPPIYVPAAPPPEPREWQGTDTSVIHAGQVVIHNDRQWIQFWSEHRPHEAAPEIDFTRDMVIGVFAGPRPAEQFSIRIVDARALPGSLVVDYRERLPPPGTFAVNVTVYPYDIKVVPRSTLPVKFNGLSPENVVR
jgi:hypothetical protein